MVSSRQWVVAVLAGALIAVAMPSVRADDTMRCGSRLVNSGDGKDKVRALCGEPTSVSFVGVQSAPSYYYRNYRGPYDYSYIGRRGPRCRSRCGPTTSAPASCCASCVSSATSSMRSGPTAMDIRCLAPIHA